MRYKVNKIIQTRFPMIHFYGGNTTMVAQFQ